MENISPSYQPQSSAQPTPVSKPPRFPNAPRAIGVIMVALAFIAMVWLGVEWNKEYSRVISLPQNMNPANMFVNVHDFVPGLALIVSLFGLAIMVLTLGIYRIITNTKSRALTFTVFFVAFGLAIISALGINHMRIGVQKDLLTAEHTWAEQRYGIQYDQITDRKWEGRKGSTHYAQDQVIKDGEVIASVCEQDKYNILFCEPGTSIELPVFLNN